MFLLISFGGYSIYLVRIGKGIRVRGLWRKDRKQGRLFLKKKDRQRDKEVERR